MQLLIMDCFLPVVNSGGTCLLRQGVFLDANGNIAEGPNMNVAIITEDGTFVVRTHRSEPGSLSRPG